MKLKFCSKSIYEICHKLEKKSDRFILLLYICYLDD